MKITVGNMTASLPAGSTVEGCLRALSAFPDGTMAALANGAMTELNTPLRGDCTLVPLTFRDEEGRRVYERSLRFVLLLALRRLYPGEQVRIEYSVGHGVLVRLPRLAMSEGMVRDVEEEMRAIVAADMPFIRRRWRLQVEEKQARYLAEHGALPDPDEELMAAERTSMPFED